MITLKLLALNCLLIVYYKAWLNQEYCLPSNLINIYHDDNIKANNF